jgi:O-antigen/teichoic acid export membrane protein
LKKSLISGVFWSAVDRFAVVALQVVFEIILARLLLPADYGLIGMVAVFIAIAQVFVDSGFMNALIQKKDRTETDYSTVFYTSVGIALLIYSILFFCAPLIAQFYGVPELKWIVRILGLNILFNSVAIVYRAKLSVSMDFKSQARYSIIAVVISGVIGIWMASEGWGVWSLVIQMLCMYALNTVLLIFNLRWWPVYGFSMESFRRLFGFGSKLLLAGVIQAVYSNVYQLVIGKVYRASDLGLYTKSMQFTLYPSSMITNMLQRVMFPYLSDYQDDNVKLFELNRQYYSLIAMAFFPLFTGLAILAEPFVSIFLTDTWLAAVPVLQILSFAFLFFPFINVNMYVFQIKGLSGRFLFVEIITKVTGIFILIVTLNISLMAMCWGVLIQQIIQWIITSYFADKTLKSRLFSQVRALLPIVIFSLLLFFLMQHVLLWFNSSGKQLFFGIILIFLSYLIFFIITMKSTLTFVSDKIKTHRSK